MNKKTCVNCGQDDERICSECGRCRDCHISDKDFRQQIEARITNEPDRVAQVVGLTVLGRMGPYGAALAKRIEAKIAPVMGKDDIGELFFN